MAGDPTLSPWLDSASPSVENSRLAGLPLKICFQELRGTFYNKALKSHSAVVPESSQTCAPNHCSHLSFVRCYLPLNLGQFLRLSPECLLEGPVYIQSEAAHCAVGGSTSPPLKTRSYQNEPGLQCFSKTRNINTVLGTMRNTCHQTEGPEFHSPRHTL